MKTKCFLCLLLSFVLVLGMGSSVAAQHKSARHKKASGSARRGFVAATENKSSDGVWQKVEKSSIRLSLSEFQNITPRRIDSYQTFTLNPDALRRILQRVSTQSNGTPNSRPRTLRTNTPTPSSSTVLTVPLPDGTFPGFTIQESSIMAPELAAKFPNIKTYAGQGVTDNTATLRLDYSPDGLHAMVLSSSGTFYVDPFRKGDNKTHIAYSLEARRQDREPFRCVVDEDRAGRARRAPAVGEAKTFSAGGSIRTYRLAVAATGEYTQFQGGTVERALRAIITTVNRVVNIYTRDLGISLILVGQEDSIIYTDPTTDPYTNNNDSKLLDENQTNLDAVIGSANYDIGHVFGTGGGGFAGVGVVCDESQKAMGETGSPNPISDAFDVDYVAHEMGHQFGANHTFNAISQSCGGNRHAVTAYEPGSGSTIMGYAGICGTEDLQPHSNDYFHIISLLEIVNYVSSISGGPAPVANHNLPPVVSVGPDHIIPKGTPFTLTATGNDPDGDQITFCWEEFDLGEAAPPDTDVDGRSRPIFRSFGPGLSPLRTLPRLESILLNSFGMGEAYPSLERGMSFRVTARDNHSGGGAFSYDTIKISVSASNGPFNVTEPNTQLTWLAGTSQTITWDVANTSGPPVNCSLVNVLLSTDGGNTFSVTLAKNTPNDGTETIVVPNVRTTRARIKVEAADNIFFDISDADFTIATQNPEPHILAKSTSRNAYFRQSAAVLQGKPTLNRRRQR